MLGDGSGSSWRFPVGASLCGVGGIGSPMPMDLFGGHTLGGMTVSAIALGVFLAATVWMFRRWGTGDAAEPVTLAQDESEAIWAELERELDHEPASPPETEVHEPV